MLNINMINLAAQQKLIRKPLEIAIANVLDNNDYILGAKVSELEQSLAKFCKAKYAIACANGTDALILVLMTKNLTTKNAVFVPAFTFAATIEAVVLSGATPIFVDVLEDSFNIDPNSLKNAIILANKSNLRPTGIIAVDLFGTPADYNKLNEIATDNNLWILCDAAQSFGARYLNSAVGTLGMATTTSFFPAKPLGCYGDGGCIFTDDIELAENLVSIRAHGVAINNNILDRYNHVNLGMNSRLDTIQAAVLLEKLKIFPEELGLREQVAYSYNNLLINIEELILPQLETHKTSSWAQYTIKLKKYNNKWLQTQLGKHGISSVIYYPKPMHAFKPYENYPKVDLQISEKLPSMVISIPMHAYLTLTEQQYIAEKLSFLIHQ